MVKNLQCGRPEFDSWIRKIPWRKKWQPTPVFLLGEFHGQEEPGGLQSTGSQKVGHDRAINTFTFAPSKICIERLICIRHCSRHWRCTSEESKSRALLERPFSWGKRHVSQ